MTLNPSAEAGPPGRARHAGRAASLRPVVGESALVLKREIWIRTYEDGRRARLYHDAAKCELEVVDPTGQATISAPSWRTLVDAQDALDRLVDRAPLGAWTRLV